MVEILLDFFSLSTFYFHHCSRIFVFFLPATSIRPLGESFKKGRYAHLALHGPPLNLTESETTLLQQYRDVQSCPPFLNFYLKGEETRGGHGPFNN